MIPRAALTAELGYLRAASRVPVRFLFEGDRLQLSSQSDARLQTSLEAAGTGEAWLCVNELYEWLRLVKDAEVGIRFTKGAAVFAHTNGAVKIPTVVVTPPTLQETPVTAEIQLPTALAEEMVRIVSMARPDGYHAYIDGMLFESKDHAFTIGAANGILLGASDIQHEASDFRAVLGEAAVIQLVKTMRDGAKDVLIRLHERAVSFVCGPRETTMPLSGGSRFPAFRKFLPKGTYRMDARAEDVRNALTAVITPARDVHAVAMNTDAGETRFAVGDSSAVISCFGALPAMKVSAADLQSVMKTIESERVEFICDGPIAPFAIRPLSGRTAVYMMSPIR